MTGHVATVEPEVWPLAEQAVALEAVPRQLAVAIEAHGYQTWAEVESGLSELTLLSYHGVARVHIGWLRNEIARRKRGLRDATTGRTCVPCVTRLPLPSKPQDRAGVYFVQCGQFVKIGMARSVRKRLRHFHQAIPFQVDLLGVVAPDAGQSLRAAEKAMHARFAVYRQIGEWFRREGELDEVCHRLASGASL